MKYSDYIKQDGLLLKILLKLKVLERQEQIIKLDLTPDADVVPTDWRDEDNNYFKNSWKFGSYFSTVIKFNFGTKRVYHFEDIEVATKELKMELDVHNIAHSLNLIDRVDDRYFAENGANTNFNETFDLHKVRLVSIDNVKKKIWYDGSFYGNHEVYFFNDWDVFSEIYLTGIPSFLPSFYKELLGESYLLFKSGNYKMSYFIAYSALENYVNEGLDSNESEERLKDKLSRWFASKTDNLSKHQVYCGIIAQFDVFTRNRNIIAHGKESLVIDQSQAESVLLFVTTLICSFEYNLSTFAELSAEIN